MSLASYSIRQHWRKPGRTLLTLAGIAIGVAGIVSISITITTTRRAYREMFESVSGRAELEVVPAVQSTFAPEAVLAALSDVPGLEASVPVVQTQGALLGKSGTTGVIILGIDPTTDGKVRDYALAEGEMLGEADLRDRRQVALLEKGFAAAQGLRDAGTVRVWSKRGIVTLEIAGLLEPRGAAAIAGGALLVVPLTTAQELFGVAGQCNSVQLVLDGNANRADIERMIANKLPEGLTVQVPASRGDLANESLLSTEQGLSALSVVSLVAGAFVILNTFLMSMAERRRSLAVLRSIGATRIQIFRMLLRESLVLGIVGTVVGMGLGWLIASLLSGAFEGMLGIPLRRLEVNATPFLLGLITGPVIAVAATIIPARSAAQRQPLQELVESRGADADGTPGWLPILGLGLIVFVVGIESLFLNELLPGVWLTPLIAPVMGVFLVGAVLVVPIVLIPILPGIRWLVGRILGVEGRLAMGQLRRRPTRSALTIGVLVIALMIALGIGTTLLNNLRDIQTWHSRIIVADYLVRGMLPDRGTLASASLPESLAEEMSAWPEMRVVDKAAFLQGRIGTQQVIILARTFHEPDRLPLDLDTGEPQDVHRRLLAGEVVLATQLAHRLGVRPGETIPLRTRSGPVDVPVAALTTEYTVGGSALYMEWETARRLFGLDGISVLLVTAREGQEEALGDRLAEFSESNALLVQSNKDFRDLIDEMVGGVVVFLWLLMVLVFVVASLGIVNTLTMNVVEQTRELGILRAIGTRRAQIRKMILGQAVGLALASVLLGTVGGLSLAQLLNVNSAVVFGRPIDFHFEPVLITLCCAGSFLISVAAAILPAERAARLPVIEALHYQ